MKKTNALQQAFLAFLDIFYPLSLIYREERELLLNPNEEDVVDTNIEGLAGTT